MSQSTNNFANYIGALADLLRDDFKQSQYGRIVPPFTLLRRLDCVLEDSKAVVLDEVEHLAPQNLPKNRLRKFWLGRRVS
ncbi:MAG: type I restriction-modification system subunit M N-terminal domain-containing protein [Hellea sp.]